jgi:hypothetical protein
MDKAKIFDYYVRKINDKDFNIHHVRQELEKNNYQDEEIKTIVRLVENEIQRRIRLNSTTSKFRKIILLGQVIVLVTLFMAIGGYTGIIKMENSFLLIYGPLVGALAILIGVTGIRKNQHK